MTLTDLQKERVDGAMLIGFGRGENTYNTVIEDTIEAQKVYHFLEPIASYRSIDGEDSSIVSWQPITEAYSRLRKWRQNGLNVPRDVSLSKNTVSILASLSASEKRTENGKIIEISLPPISPDGMGKIKQELLCRHEIIATNGYGVEPLRIEEEDSKTIEEIKHRTQMTQYTDN